MATFRVRLEFYRAESTSLTFFHHLSLGFIENADAASRNSGYNELFEATVAPFLKEREADCAATARSHCSDCGRPAVKMIQVPVC